MTGQALPGEARRCPRCRREIGLTQHGRYARHKPPSGDEWCSAGGTLPRGHRTPTVANDIDTRARLAVLEVMGWDDDRNHPGTEDGVPPAAHWTLAGELAAAVAPLLRRQAAEEIAVLIWDPKTDPDALKTERSTWWRGFRLSRRDAATIALEHCPAPDHTTTDQGGPDGRRDDSAG